MKALRYLVAMGLAVLGSFVLFDLGEIAIVLIKGDSLIYYDGFDWVALGALVGSALLLIGIGVCIVQTRLSVMVYSWVTTIPAHVRYWAIELVGGCMLLMMSFQLFMSLSMELFYISEESLFSSLMLVVGVCVVVSVLIYSVALLKAKAYGNLHGLMLGMQCVLIGLIMSESVPVYYSGMYFLLELYGLLMLIAIALGEVAVFLRFSYERRELFRTLILCVHGLLGVSSVVLVACLAVYLNSYPKTAFYFGLHVAYLRTYVCVIVGLKLSFMWCFRNLGKVDKDVECVA